MKILTIILKKNPTILEKLKGKTFLTSHFFFIEIRHENLIIRNTKILGCLKKTYFLYSLISLKISRFYDKKNHLIKYENRLPTFLNSKFHIFRVPSYSIFTVPPQELLFYSPQISTLDTTDFPSLSPLSGHSCESQTSFHYQNDPKFRLQTLN